VKLSLKKLVLPLTILLFCSLTKVWHTVPVDARDTHYWGFPFAFVGEGWHTSMSLQFFVLEMIADFAVYMLFCTLLVYLLQKLIPTVLSNKWVSRILWTVASLFLLAAGLIISTSQPVFHLMRPYDWVIKETGIGGMLIDIF
jgi:hypothetical protein